MTELPDDTIASINCFEITNLPLQNLTLDQTIPAVHGVNAKTPGKASPVGGSMSSGPGAAGSGRTMKDFEDQLGALKKENFNLKLRIYFLEEQMGITSADEDAIKRNIELKVENQSLRKELIEKQELLGQAAKAIELIEEQKQVSARNQVQYQQTLEQEREKTNRLEKELQVFRGRLTDATYFEEAFGITPKKALEYKDKLNQLEEIKSSLESELKQLTASLEEERNWAKELEAEKDEFRNRLELGILSKEKLSTKKDQDIESLKEKAKELSEQIFKKENSLQKLRTDVIERDKIIYEKSALLKEKFRAHEEITVIAEKRKKQIDQLRLSIKTRDDALTELNNKNRSLIAQFENNYAQRCISPASSSTIIEESRNFRKTFNISSPIRSFNATQDFEPNTERSRITNDSYNNLEKTDMYDFKKDIEDKEREIIKCEEAKKQLSIKLYNVEKSAEITDKKLKKLETDHRKAIQMIQGFMKRHDQLEDKQVKKDRRIIELEFEISRLQHENLKSSRSSVDSSVRKNLCNEMIDGPERDHNGQQRFEGMKSTTNDFRDQNDVIRTEKNSLKKQKHIDSKELQYQIKDKTLRIEWMTYEKNLIQDEIKGKSDVFDTLKEAYDRPNTATNSPNAYEIESLREQLSRKNVELQEKNDEIVRLSKDLQIKTQNLQQLVNTELWNKNKEIAKLHNYMTDFQYQEKGHNKLYDLEESATYQLHALIKELNDIGIQAVFMNDIVQLNYVDGDKPVDIITTSNYIHELITQKSELEKEVDYLKWLKLVSKPMNDNQTLTCDSIMDKDKRYSAILRTHLKEMIKFRKEVLLSMDHIVDVDNYSEKKIVFNVLLNSRHLPDGILNSLEDMIMNDTNGIEILKKYRKMEKYIRKSKSENSIDSKNKLSTSSDSETFSESDRMVSLERIGLANIKQMSVVRMRPSKLENSFSDSEDFVDNSVDHKICQYDIKDNKIDSEIPDLQDMSSFLYFKSNTLITESLKTVFDEALIGRLSLLPTKHIKLQRYYELFQSILKKIMHECYTLRKENKQNCCGGLQLANKILELESLTLEVTDQKVKLLQYKENTSKKTTQILTTLKKENELLKTKIKKLEEDDESKIMILRLTRDLDQLTLAHSQILVENTKLTNDKLKLEQELRKSESRYDLIVRKFQSNFQKEVIDLNQSNESHRVRIHEFETANNQFCRHVACEASYSAPSCNSSIPIDVAVKETCDDTSKYHVYNGSKYWMPISYRTSSGFSKSSCSPDLGIESDAAVTSTRPLKDTLKITESMTNLLNDNDNSSKNEGLQNTDVDTPSPKKGLDEVQSLKQENIALKRRLIKTRRALEDTFRHLTTSNKNKKNVEKAITKQLMITKSVLKKARNYEEVCYRK